jgi:protein involved in polysaccharide export with SLBB domain
MRLWILLGVTIIATFCFPSTSSEQETHPAALAGRSEYRIRVGDVIQITIYQHEHRELNKRVVVDDKGRISLPRLHTVKASGLTALDLAITIRQKLLKTTTNPQVAVTVGDVGPEMRDVVQPTQIRASASSPRY